MIVLFEEFHEHDIPLAIDVTNILSLSLYTTDKYYQIKIEQKKNSPLYGKSFNDKEVAIDYLKHMYQHIVKMRERYEIRM